MSRVRVYELAKELGVESKTIIELLDEYNINVKSQSGLDEDLVNMVRYVLGDKAKTKKKKTVVFNLGNDSKRSNVFRNNVTAPRPIHPSRPTPQPAPRKVIRRGPNRLREGVEVPSAIRARKENEEKRKEENTSKSNDDSIKEGVIIVKEGKEASFVIKEVDNTGLRRELAKDETSFNIRINSLDKKKKEDNVIIEDVEIVIDVKKGKGFKNDSAIIATVNENSEAIVAVIQQMLD